MNNTLSRTALGRQLSGTSTRNGKPLTRGSVNYIARNAGKMSTKAIASVLHRPVQTVKSVALKLGVSLRVR